MIGFSPNSGWWPTCLGAVFWIISLVFRVYLGGLGSARDGLSRESLPIGFEAWQQWAAMLFAIYMVIGYLSVAAYGGALLGTGLLARWLGWTAVIFGLAGALGYTLGFVVQFRLFHPPLNIHLVPGLIGIFLLLRVRGA